MPFIPRRPICQIHLLELCQISRGSASAHDPIAIRASSQPSGLAGRLRLRRPRPEGAAEARRCRRRSFRRLTLRSATGTPQRGSPYL